MCVCTFSILTFTLFNTEYKCNSIQCWLVLRISIHSACFFYSFLSLALCLSQSHFHSFGSFSLDFSFAICFLFHFLVHSSLPFCLFYSFSWLVFTYYNTRIAAQQQQHTAMYIERASDCRYSVFGILFNKSYHKMIKCVVLHPKNNIKKRWNNQNKTGRCEVCWFQSNLHTRIHASIV